MVEWGQGKKGNPWAPGLPIRQMPWGRYLCDACVTKMARRWPDSRASTSPRWEGQRGASWCCGRKADTHLWHQN